MNKPDFNKYFDQKFDNASKTEFEDWFTMLAERVWSDDFETIKAGGRHGDKKCDGWRISTGTVFQCYGPESPATFAKVAPGKIGGSFPDVLSYWPNTVEWKLIHNNKGGVTGKVSDAIENLKVTYPEVIFSTGSRNYLKDELHDKLSISQMLDVYPMAELDFKNVEMQHVRPLLKRIIVEKTACIDPTDFGEIPDEQKLDYNDLSLDSKLFLTNATAHMSIVDRFLAGMSDPRNASALQAEMRAKYHELKGYSYEPDEILGKLISFIRGVEDDTKTMAAAYVVAAYYFDACDIFENAPEGVTC